MMSFPRTDLGCGIQAGTDTGEVSSQGGADALPQGHPAPLFSGQAGWAEGRVEP